MSDCHFGVSPANYPDPDPADPDQTAPQRPIQILIMYTVCYAIVCIKWLKQVSNRLSDCLKTSTYRQGRNRSWTKLNFLLFSDQSENVL